MTEDIFDVCILSDISGPCVFYLTTTLFQILRNLQGSRQRTRHIVTYSRNPHRLRLVPHPAPPRGGNPVITAETPLRLLNIEIGYFVLCTFWIDLFE